MIVFSNDLRWASFHVFRILWKLGLIDRALYSDLRRRVVEPMMVDHSVRCDIWSVLYKLDIRGK